MWGWCLCFIGILKKSSSFRPARSEAEKSPDFRGISLDGAIDGGMSRSAKGGLDMTVYKHEFVISIRLGGGNLLTLGGFL